MGRADIKIRGTLDEVDLQRQRVAWRESVTVNFREEVRGRTLNVEQVFALHAHLGHTGQQRPSVGMAGVVVNFVRSADLHDVAGIHDGHTVGDVGHVLGMRLLRTSENPEYKYTLAFLGYEDGESAAEIELTYNWGVTEYDLGNAYGHIAIGVDDIYATCEAVRAHGGKVTREAGPVKGGTTVIAFVEDPDGYKIEFIENKSAKSALGN